MEKKSYPKITIVTQCYNRAQYIAETIESVLSQNYPNLEYIVIDDGSTDGSWEIIQRYKDRLAHVEHMEGTRDTPVPAINRGLSMATGEIMMWLNSKNMLMPKSLFTVADIFTTFLEVEWITGMGLIIDGESKITGVIPVRKDKFEHMVGSRANIQQESTFWRKSLWDRTHASLDAFSVSFDVRLWSTKFFPAAPLYHVNTLFGAYRKDSSSFSTVRRREFLADIERSRRDLWALASKKDRTLATLYRVIRFGKPILRNIPDRVFCRIPILNAFAHKAIRYARMENNRGVLEIYKRNPFRTIFPW